MKKRLLLAGSVLVFLFGMICSVAAQEESSSDIQAEDSIEVTADGFGLTYDEALRNAYKDAVYKAVGVFLVSETKVKDEDIDEKIYLNSDAIVHNVKKLEQRREEDGAYYVKIRAYVIRNELADRIRKYVTTHVSETTVVSNLNKVDALSNALKSLELLFQNFPEKILIAEAIGEPQVDSDADFQEGMIFLKQQVRVRLDSKRYHQFTEELRFILSAVALKEYTGKYERQTVDTEVQTLSGLNQFAKNNEDKAVVIFHNRFPPLHYFAYVIPKPVHKAIPWHNEFVVIVDYQDEFGRSLYSEKFDLSCHSNGYSSEPEGVFCGFTNTMPFLSTDRWMTAEGNGKFLFPIISFNRKFNRKTGGINFIIEIPMTCRISMKQDLFKKIRKVKVFVKSEKGESSGSSSSGSSCSGRRCSVCNGWRYIEKEVDTRIKCRSCGGRGSVTSRISGGFNPHDFSSFAGQTVQRTCSECGGRGWTSVGRRIKREPCPRCAR